MGFKRRVYHLTFADPSWNGLEVDARGASLDQAIELERLLNLGPALADPANETERKTYYGLLASLLIDWNLVDDEIDLDGMPTGREIPVPCNEEQLRKEDFVMVSQITRAWLRAVITVAPPLPTSSNSGEQDLPGQFELMEAASLSQTS